MWKYMMVFSTHNITRRPLAHKFVFIYPLCQKAPHVGCCQLPTGGAICDSTAAVITLQPTSPTCPCSSLPLLTSSNLSPFLSSCPSLSPLSRPDHHAITAQVDAGQVGANAKLTCGQFDQLASLLLSTRAVLSQPLCV